MNEFRNFIIAATGTLGLLEIAENGDLLPRDTELQIVLVKALITLAAGLLTTVLTQIFRKMSQNRINRKKKVITQKTINMGRYIKGILGGFSGKIGNIIGGKWKGIHYMRSLSDTSNNEPTEKQIIHRAKFGFASRFLQPLQPVLKVGFRTQDKNRSPQNAAMSDLMRHVIEGDYPSYRVNFEKFRISKGSLVVANTCQVELVDNKINFTWTDTPQIVNSYGDNLALMVAIGEDIYPTYSFTEILRSDQGGSIPAPTGVSGTTIYCYLAFAHEDPNREVSNSKLVGIVTLP